MRPTRSQLRLTSSLRISSTISIRRRPTSMHWNLESPHPTTGSHCLHRRAQVLWSQGQHARAQAIIDYLVYVGGAYTKRVEETPSGLTVTVEASPEQVWARYLSARAADGAATQSHPRLDIPSEMIDLPLQNPFAAPDAPPINRGAGNAPLAPIFRVGEALQDLRVADPDRPDIFQPARPHPSLGPAWATFLSVNCRGIKPAIRN